MAVLRSLTTTLGLNSAQFRSELQRATRSYGAFGSAIAAGTKSAGRAIGGLTSAVTSVKGALVAVGTGAALYGIKQAYEHADEIRRQGEMVGVAAGKWSAYEKAAKMVGISSENVADVFKDLNVRITDAAKNGSGAMVDFFDQINQDAREWAALSPDEQFRRFTVELNEMSQSDARFWLDEVNDSAVKMFETLVKNDGEFLKLADDANRLGLSLTSAQFEMIGGARRELETLAATGSGVWQQVLAASAPAITAVSKGIRQWINDQAEAAGGFRQLGVVIAETVLQAVVDTARTLEKVLNTTYQGAEKLAGMMGKTLNPQKNQLKAELKATEAYIKRLKNETESFIYNDSPFPIEVSADEKIAEIDRLQARADDLRLSLIQPFNFADSLEGQVSGIVAIIKAAQVDIQSSAPVNAFGTGQIDGSTDDKQADKLASQLDAIRSNYATQEQLLLDKTLSEQEILAEALENRLMTEQEWQELSGESWAGYYEQVATLNEQAEQRKAQAEQQYAQQSAAMRQQVAAQALGLIKSSAQQGSAVWMAALAVEKGLAIARTLINAQVASTNALASLPYPANLAASAQMLAMGNISAGLIAAQGVAEIAGGRAMGGEVKAGSTYLVGERGAELFVPNADGQITSHDKLAAAARGAGQSGGVQSVTLAPSIVVESGASQSGDEFLAENVAAQVFNMLITDAKTGGVLSRALGAR